MINREIIYERNLTGSFMKIVAPPGAGLDETLMLRRKLPGLLPVEKAYVDGDGQYWYNISGKQSLDTYCRVKDVGIAFIERLIISICSEMEILEWNLIQTSCLVLDPELVFITNCNQEIIFTVYPGGNSTVELEFQQLMEYLLTKLDHKDAAAVRTAYSIYEKTLTEGYSIQDIREEILKERRRETAKEQTPPIPPLPASPEMPKPADAAPESVPPEKEKKRRRPQTPDWLKKIKDFLTDAGILEKAIPKAPEPVYPEEEPIAPPQPQYHPTVCLTGAAKPRGVLLYQGAGQFEDIEIGIRTLCIGYGAQADVQIRHDTISQMHARIGSGEDGYYIEDLNSTNGTFVNEKPLAYKERRKLNSNDIICFADVRYRFC